MKRDVRGPSRVLGQGLVFAVLGSACLGHAERTDVSALGQAVSSGGGGGSDKVNRVDFPNASGILRTYTDNPKTMLTPNKTGTIAFFQALGTNGRACIHCHTPGDAWTITPQSATFRFTHALDVTDTDCVASPSSCRVDSNPQNYGLTDPLFRLNDGAVSPNADVSTPQARQVAYSMLLRKGLIRIGIRIPAGAEFTLVAVDDPYRYASANELSLFRRPLPSTNLRISPTDTNPTPNPTLTGVMWDGRETLPGHDIIFDLMDQANGATLGHAQATAGLSDAARAEIVDFETGLHTAQAVDNGAGALSVDGANGGPEWLGTNQPFYVGINDVLTGDSVTHAPFDPNVFTVYTAWNLAADAARAAIARGEALFDTKPIAIRGVGGLNDALDIDTLPGSCTTCHDAPNYGHHSVKLPVNIGIADASLRTNDMPLYTFEKVGAPGVRVQTTDPGRALVTGKWADIGKFKGPILRGLAGRAPYFHNGSAASLDDVLRFYDQRFGVGFTAQEKGDLIAFLRAL
jgi:hypothetical protein